MSRKRAKKDEPRRLVDEELTKVGRSVSDELYEYVSTTSWQEGGTAAARGDRRATTSREGPNRLGSGAARAEDTVRHPLYKNTRSAAQTWRNYKSSSKREFAMKDPKQATTSSSEGPPKEDGQ